MSTFLSMMPGHRHMRGLFGAVYHDPVTLAVSAASVTAAGSIQQGNAAAKSLKSQAAADDYNASVDRSNESAVNQTGTQRELATRTNNAMKMGEERAAVGEANIGGPSGGTQSLTLEQDSVNSELSALGVRYQRDTEAAGLEDQARQENFQGSVARNSAKQAKIAGYIGAVGSVLQGANRYQSQQAQVANASPPGQANLVSPQSQYGPFDNSLPWRNQAYVNRGGAF